MKNTALGFAILRNLPVIDRIWPLFAIAPTIIISVALVYNATFEHRLILIGALFTVWLCTLPIAVFRIKELMKIKFITQSGTYVYWTEEQFAVNKQDVEEITAHTIKKYKDAYDQIESARKARHSKIGSSLRGASITFREHPFLHSKYKPKAHLSERMLSGIQDGKSLEVGFKSPISTTALEHELGHLILRYDFKVLGSTDAISETDEHHQIMKKIGAR